MVEKLIEASTNGDLQGVNLHAKSITTGKLHDKTGIIGDEINARFHEIIGKTEQGRLVFVDPTLLKKAVRLFQKKSYREKREEIVPEIAFSGMYDAGLSEKQIKEIRGPREGKLLRDHFYDKSKPRRSFHGYVFYSHKESRKGQKNEIVGCIYEFYGKEYILVDAAIAKHPESAEEFIKVLKEKYKKVHGKYHTQDGEYLQFRKIPLDDIEFSS